MLQYSTPVGDRRRKPYFNGHQNPPVLTPKNQTKLRAESIIICHAFSVFLVKMSVSLARMSPCCPFLICDSDPRVFCVRMNVERHSAPSARASRRRATRPKRQCSLICRIASPRSLRCRRCSQRCERLVFVEFMFF
jgi:hypothetical protein